jgi:hypothetical protein
MKGCGAFKKKAIPDAVKLVKLLKDKGKAKNKVGGSMGIDAMAAQKNLLTGNGKKNKKGKGFFDDMIGSIPDAVKLVKLLKGKGKAKNKVGGSWFSDAWDGISTGFMMPVNLATSVVKSVI